MKRRPHTTTGHHVHFPSSTLPDPTLWYQANQVNRTSPFRCQTIPHHPRQFLNVETFNLHPNVRVSKSAGKLYVTVKTTNQEEKQKPQKQKKLKPEEMEALIVDLRDQVTALSTFLEEERLHHGGTKKRAMLDLDNQSDALKQQHVLSIKRLMESNERHVSSMEESHRRKILEMEIEAKKREDQLRTEYRILQASFKNYRSTLQIEMNDQMKLKVEEMEWHKNRAVQNALDDCKREMEEKFSKERETMRKEFRSNVAEMLRDHRLELEEMSKKFLDGGHDLEELKRRSDNLDDAKMELQDTKALLEEERTAVRRVKSQLKDSQMKLSSLESDFETRVSSVEDLHRSRIESLTLERADVKRLLTRSWEELQSEKMARETAENERKEAAKRSMEKKIQKCQKPISAKSAGSSSSQNERLWQSRSLESHTASIIDITYNGDNSCHKMKSRSDSTIECHPNEQVSSSEQNGSRTQSAKTAELTSPRSNTRHPLRFNVPPISSTNEESTSTSIDPGNPSNPVRIPSEESVTLEEPIESYERPPSPTVIH
uniref:Uncharacterized protein n=1 Tax=Ciona savignyi TaxID=51511 RepID=H2ZEK7_CIOSA